MLLTTSYNSRLTCDHSALHHLVSYVTSLHLSLSLACSLLPNQTLFPVYLACHRKHIKKITTTAQNKERSLPSRYLILFSFNPYLLVSLPLAHPPCLWIEHLLHANCGLFSLIHHNCCISPLPFRLNVSCLTHVTPTVCLMHVWLCVSYIKYVCACVCIFVC